METSESIRTRMWCWRRRCTVAALDNKLFRGQIAHTNPVFHPDEKKEKKYREWGRENERDGEREREKLKSNKQWCASLLSWIYLRIL